MEVNLSKKQRLVTNAAAKERRRPALCCVHIRKGIIEACDGFILAQRAINYSGEEELLLDATQIAKHKDSKSLGGVVYSTQEDSDEVKGLGEEKYITQKQAGTFPLVDVFYPTGEPILQIGLSRNNLLKLLKCLDKNEESIRFTFYSKTFPVKFEVGDKIKGIIMPT